MMLNNSENSAFSSRKTLLERLAALRIQSSPKGSSSAVKAPESPHFIPRSNQNVSTKSKFYNYNNPNESAPSSVSSSQSEILSSPSIGRRRKFSGLSATTAPSNGSAKPQVQNTESPIGISSPKYFPKQRVFEIPEPIEFPQLTIPEEIQIERTHSAKEAVTSFIDSFTILNNFLIKATNSTTAKLHLQNMNTSFAALQMDLKKTLKTLSQLQEQLRMNSETEGLKLLNDNMKSEIEILRSNNETLISDNNNLKADIKKLKSKIDNPQMSSSSKELEEQLKIALSQIAEIKIAYEKEKENVEFLQNYMEEVIQLKDEGELQILNLEKKISDLIRGETEKVAANDLEAENEKLKETLKLLELERSSNKNVCKQALEVLDAAARNSPAEVERLQEELKHKQIEIEKLRGREQHFKESNEIFQQKLMILTEENRKLKGQRPINHY